MEIFLWGNSGPRITRFPGSSLDGSPAEGRRQKAEGRVRRRREGSLKFKRQNSKLQCKVKN